MSEFEEEEIEFEDEVEIENEDYEVFGDPTSEIFRDPTSEIFRDPTTEILGDPTSEVYRDPTELFEDPSSELYRDPTTEIFEDPSEIEEPITEEYIPELFENEEEEAALEQTEIDTESEMKMESKYGFLREEMLEEGEEEEEEEDEEEQKEELEEEQIEEEFGEEEKPIMEIGRMKSSSLREDKPVSGEFDIRKPSKDKKLERFLSELQGEKEVSSLRTYLSVSGDTVKSQMPKYLHQLYAEETPPESDDEFSWPHYMLDDRDQVYENLITKTVCNEDLMVIENERVIMRRDHASMADKVKLIGGGKAGTDPLFTGYVGPGMLTAAVIGDRHEAPRVSSIDKAIDELSSNHKSGILIIVQNSYENRLTFGLAMQRARQKGILIDMITVIDDCFEDKRPGGAGRPGLTGILFLLKIAGAMSENGRHMKEIFITCRTLLIATISSHILSNEIRIGTSFTKDGAILDVKDVKLEEIVTWLIQYLTHPCRYFSIPLSPLNRVAVLVNSYTQDSLFLYSATAEIMRQLNKLDVNIERIYAGNFVSGGGRGLSITLMKIYDDKVLEWLDHPTQVESWPSSKCGQIPNIMKTISFTRKIESSGPVFTEDQKQRLPHILNYICRAIMTVETLLNSYDVDRYIGTAIARGAAALGQLNRLKNLDTRSAYSFLKQISTVLEENMTGSIGALYGLIFQGAAEGFLYFSKLTPLEVWMWGVALEEAVKNVICFGKLKEGDCTLLDALLPPLRRYNCLVNDNSEIVHDGVALMTEFLSEARSGMKRTSQMRALTHIPGEPEVGAYAVVTIFSAILEAIK